MTNSYDPIWHHESPGNMPNFLSKEAEMDLNQANKPPIPSKRPLFELAEERTERRSAGYGKENAFPYIRDLWNWYIRARITDSPDDFSLTDADTALMLLLFKVGRKVSRQIGGAPPKRDDNVDIAGYLKWLDELERQ